MCRKAPICKSRIRDDGAARGDLLSTSRDSDVITDIQNADLNVPKRDAIRQDPRISVDTLAAIVETEGGINPKGRPG